MKAAMAAVCIFSLILMTGQAGADAGTTLKQAVPDRVYLKIDFTGGGNGTVQIAPGEVECRASEQVCSVGFREGTEIVLAAKASGPNSRFSGWIGRCDIVDGAGPDACRIRLTENTKITAFFSDNRFRIFSFNFPNLLRKERGDAGTSRTETP